MSWMAPCDELGDRREPVGLGNSVGSNADAALTFKAVHGRVGNEPLDRAARERELDTVTELHCVNLSPENRFEASPLRGDSTATGTFRRSARIDGNEWQFPRAYRRYTAGVSERASKQIAERLGVAAGNVSSCLSKLAAYGIIRKSWYGRDPRGNVYRALTDEQAASKSPTICSRSPTR